MTEPERHDTTPVTTNGDLAVANLGAQIGGLTAQLHRTRATRPATARLPVTGATSLVDLLLLRGRVLGRIADYERAADLAKALVRDAPSDSAARLARARTRATFHRFPEALADLDAAERTGADGAVLAGERTAALQGLGCYAEALVACRSAAEHRPDFGTLGAFAVLQAERGEVTEAERLFTEARQCYRGVSPFPVAELDFRRGHMWLRERDPAAARDWFAAAVRRVPRYAPAVGHLAEVEAGQGDREAAIGRLRPLLLSSDDPEYPALLARLLQEAGRCLEARRWRGAAAARYDELLARHPDAFTDHAAEFWLTTGGDPQRWLGLARQTREAQRAARQRVPEDLLRRAA